jgi:hypothetical protein
MILIGRGKLKSELLLGHRPTVHELIFQILLQGLLLHLEPMLRLWSGAPFTLIQIRHWLPLLVMM